MRTFGASAVSALLGGAVLVAGITGVAAAFDDFSIKGYYKNLFQYTGNASTSRITSDLNRVRLELRGEPLPRLRGELVLDNELTAGSILETEEFRLQKDAPRRTFLNHEATVADSSDLLYRLSTYRAFLSYDYGSGDIVAGHQRIAWGTAKLWNPTDLFNPYNPVSIERDERPGVDAIRLEHTLGPLSKVTAAYAPGATSSKSSVAMKYLFNISGYDLSVMAGRFHDRNAVGGDFSGTIGNVGIHGEGIIQFDRKSGPRPGLVIGGEYTFPNSLYLLFEYYFNSSGKSDSRDYGVTGVFTGDTLSLGRHYLGAVAGFDFSGVLRGELYGIYNIGDNSLFLQPLLKYSLQTNIDLSIGMQAFAGNDTSEYGRLHNLYFTQLQWYF